MPLSDPISDPNSDRPSDPQPERAGLTQTLARWRDVLLVVTLSIYGLYAGARFLVPLAVAFLVFVLITAISDRLVRIDLGGWHPPTWLGNLLGVTAVLTGLFAVMFIFGTQATSFARAIPSYEAQLDQLISRLANMIGNDAAREINSSFVNIDMGQVARSAVGGAQSFLTTFLLICLYVGFMLAERRVLTRKLERALDTEGLGGELGPMMATISSGLQGYIGVKSFISAITALLSYAVFRWLGLEFAETWAVLTFALNFIPSIGSVFAVLFATLAALIQFDTLTPVLIILLGCGTLQFLIGNMLDPALTGRRVNLSTFMVIIALTFWTTIWGILGAFLSVPLTVCLLIVFSHIPATRPLAVMMSKDGRLSTDPAGA
ncbi:AI-2E family transporter [Pukyongiella litopenaei]|uniref:AI-2E family transporter n=1 Tax=Pukyongiella litopenaei TaxID=2605946 RepID=A0A2S0MUF3_9RHOB|nr:AI-2E family transporter [Pukyongiella litopenaei]AVO39427.1 AI-2E family transporter [Pukyongiella litopenaei]